MSKQTWGDYAPAPDREEVRYHLGHDMRLRSGPCEGLTIGEAFAKDPDLVRYLARNMGGGTKLGKEAYRYLRWVDAGRTDGGLKYDEDEVLR